ncbi:MAG: EamA family transporter [Candidatus Sumerlaeaceae bacterium]|nr:EamA family transporter [Candidatus Sumerlaeaceae bacterium]
MTKEYNPPFREQHQTSGCVVPVAEVGDSSTKAFCAQNMLTTTAARRPVGFQATATKSPLVIIALITLYLVWGSTYLAICIAIETIPPFLMAGLRMLIAAAAVLGYAWYRGVLFATRKEVANAAIVGGFLLLGGNGLVVWAAQKLPSGILALLVGATPLAMVGVSWIFGGEKRPSALTFFALFVGMTGLAWLVVPSRIDVAHGIHFPSAIAAVGATLAWAIGSQYARTAELPKRRSVAIGVEMFSGGILLCLAGVLMGELPRFHVANMSWQSILAFAYLVVFGSLVGYSAYIYILEHTKPALATSYAFVNPLVAVVLGWALRGEPITSQVIVGGLLIIGAVLLITAEKAQSTQPLPEKEPELP